MKKMLSLDECMHISSKELFEKYNHQLNEAEEQDIDIDVDFEGLTFDEIRQKLHTKPIEDTYKDIFKN